MVVEEDERVQLESLNQLVCVLRVVTCSRPRSSAKTFVVDLAVSPERRANRGASCPARRRLVLD